MNPWSNVFRHHRWSNRVIIDFLTTLAGEQLELTVPGTYGSSLATVRPLVSSDADYVRIIPDAPTSPRSTMPVRSALGTSCARWPGRPTPPSSATWRA